MPRLTAAFLFVTLALTATGCKGKQMGDISDKVPPPADPLGQYRSTLATTCSDKHRETLSPDQLREQTRKWYATLDAPAHDQYDKAIRKSCAADTAQPDCTNKGIIVGAIEDGTLQKFVIQVCGSQS